MSFLRKMFELVRGAPLPLTAGDAFRAVEKDDTRKLDAILSSGAVNAATARVTDDPAFCELYKTPYSPSASLLHVAALAGHRASAAVLLLAGAPVNARDAEGQTPLDYAIVNYLYFADKCATLEQSAFRVQSLASVIAMRDQYHALIEDLRKAGGEPALFRLPHAPAPKGP